MSASDGPVQERSGERSCAFVSGEELLDWAHTVHILAMWDALTKSGIETELLAYPGEDGIPSGAELRTRYALSNTPDIAWLPRENKWIARLRLAIRSAREGGRRSFAYTTRALPALGALLGGSPAVFLEFHMPIQARHDQVAFALARRSKRLHIVCISRRLAEMIAEQYGLEVSSIIVEHSGHDLAVARDYRASSALGRRLRATYVGTIAPGRGAEMVIETAKRHPDVDFTLAGPGEPPGAAVPDNVRLMPAVPHSEVRELLLQADVLLMPYTRGAMLEDGFVGTAEYCSPLKMVEYLAAGRAIISSDLPSIAEVMVDESNCLLVDSESADAWSTAMGRLKRDPELRERLALGAAESAEEHTDIGRVERMFASVWASQ